jgi:hypothetical protein
MIAPQLAQFCRTRFRTGSRPADYFPVIDRVNHQFSAVRKEKLMIGKATIFAVAMLAPGFAFAADSAVTGAAAAAPTHESAAVKTDSKTDSVKSGVTADTNVKANATVKKVKAVKTVKTTAHKAKAVPAADKAVPASDKKIDSKS